MRCSLNQYLRNSGADSTGKSIDLLVMGNQSADLDSMVSAIVFAYIRSAAQPEKTIIPLMPIARADFKLRTEAVYVFEQAGIDPVHLVFLDDVPLRCLRERVRGLALVDHNRLSPMFADYADNVRAILDHHKDEGLYTHASPRTIEPVGSAATLVGELLIRDFPGLLDPSVAALLTGAILLDTVNLAPEAGRVTARDTAVAFRLMDTCTLDRNQYFEAIQQAKFHTAGLGTFDLLRRDYKEFVFGMSRCGIASVFRSVQQWAETDPSLCDGFAAYARQQNLDVLLSMNAYEDPEFKRNLAVYCVDPLLHDRLVTFFQASNLGLTSLSLSGQQSCSQGKISFYNQSNTGISRKKISPLLDTYFTD